MTSHEEFYDRLRVSLIATPRREFRTCAPDEHISDVVERNIEKFDFVPVLRPNGVILGLVELARYFDTPAPMGVVSDYMQPLGELHLIGADASILAFVHDADEHRFRFVVSQQGIVGLVSLSDLQKLPVRAMLFGLVTALELRMLELIRERIPETNTWQELISKKRRERIREELSKAAATEGIVDELLYTQFCDKRDIIHKSLLKGHPQRSRFSYYMKEIEGLRNSLAHANDYADTTVKAASVCQTVRNVIEIYDLLHNL